MIHVRLQRFSGKGYYERNDYHNENYNLDEIIPKLKAYTTGNVVDKVTCTEKKVLKGQGKRVALMDFGAKNNIAKSLNERGCEVTLTLHTQPLKRYLVTILTESCSQTDSRSKGVCRYYKGNKEAL